MPRKPRMYLANVPAHVVQRGNNKQACFFEESDYRYYLECLEDACRRFGVALHAYVLMPNHVHLLMTPEDSKGISKVMQSLGRRYVQAINCNLGKSGTLWEGRHKSSIIDSEQYLLACYRYIEFNPVRANLVAEPGDYRWSSYRHNALGVNNAAIKEHSLYQALASEMLTTREAYRRLSNIKLDVETLQTIRSAINFSMPLGDKHFKNEIEKILEKPIGYAKRGRPPLKIEAHQGAYY